MNPPPTMPTRITVTCLSPGACGRRICHGTVVGERPQRLETIMSERRDCRISRVETHLVGTRWCNWVFARVLTDDGITGVGEGTCEWQAKAVEAAIHQLAERHLIGQSAFAIERLWQGVFRNEFARGGAVL